VEGRQRQLSGFPDRLTRGLLVAITVAGACDVLNVASYLGLVYYRSQALALVFGLASVYVFLKFPAFRSKTPQTHVPWYDWVLALAAVVVNGYVVVVFARMSTMMEIATTDRLVLGAIGLVLCLELVRRTVGYLLIVVVLAFVLYARFADYFPDVLYARPSSWPRLLTYLYFDPAGLYGVSLDIIAGVVLTFILFGTLLFATGGAQFVMDLSLRLCGRFKGGPAKMEVVASSLFGTMTGSAAANCVFTGQFTIPLMKRAGYRPAFAAAVEAVASSGGLIMPPVMGAAAFIMADFLGISYAEVALAALVPAVLFYVAVFYQVHFVAVRDDLKSAAIGAVPSLREMLPGFLMFFVPLAMLIYFMFVRSITPERAVMYATASLLVLAVFLKRDALRWRALLGVLETTGRELIQMLVIAGLAGLILGVVTLKGLGSSMSQTLLALSSDSLLLLLALTAVTSIVLGMGLPAVAIYILLAVLVAPAMVQFGVPPIAAHMFILYFGILSYVTPPMAFACFVTAPMAGADPIKTGIEGCKLSVVAYVVPFMFVFNPALLLQGSAIEIAVAFASGVAAAVCLAAAVTGFALRRLNVVERLLLAAIGIGIFVPEPTIQGGSLVAAVGHALWQWRTRTSASVPNPAPEVAPKAAQR
jgi:TRAP transporter 4TM/12TM fusion protein